MNTIEFCHKLELVLELPSGTITTEILLKDLEGWDSLAVMAFIVMVDRDYAVKISPKAIAGCKSVNDLADLLHTSKV